MVKITYTITIGSHTTAPATFDSRLWDPDDPDDGDIAARMIARDVVERDAEKVPKDATIAEVLLTTAAGRGWCVPIAIGWERTFTAGEAHEIPK